MEVELTIITCTVEYKSTILVAIRGDKFTFVFVFSNLDIEYFLPPFFCLVVTNSVKFLNSDYVIPFWCRSDVVTSFFDFVLFSHHQKKIG